MSADLAQVCREFNDSPCYRLLGMVASSDAAGTARVALPFDARLTQRWGGIHGGFLLTLADATINVAVATTLGPDEAHASVEVSLSFLDPAGQEDLVAEGRVTKKGGRVSFGECVIKAGERDVARGHAVIWNGPRR